MSRYKVSKDSKYPPPQYLGGVGRYDVFYWTVAHGGVERLIVKWGTGDYGFYWWDFPYECWKNSYSEPVVNNGPTPEETEVILAMYECFAIKPQKQEEEI